MGCTPNASHSPVFLLRGFSGASVSSSLLFLLFLAVYLMTVVGNMTLVLLISRDPRLHTPMYYLLRGLSVIDMGVSTVILPQLLAHLVSNSPAISASRCLAQFFFFYAFGVTDTLVVSVMAVDRYVAICPCTLIVLSYIHIGATIARLPSAAGRRRAVSTCGSHLTMVGFLYGTIIWVYFQPPSQNSQDQDMVAAVMYTAITPLANPLVYSLRNKDVKRALRRLIGCGTVDS
ncbi:Olfactory Receptor 1B1 [Manis pentadactyla]|nr:Olfactory Receptor 1B1 [Manis pentadactyla]